jgi:hypothetical protein
MAALMPAMIASSHGRSISASAESSQCSHLTAIGRGRGPAQDHALQRSRHAAEVHDVTRYTILDRFDETRLRERAVLP